MDAELATPRAPRGDDGPGAARGLVLLVDDEVLLLNALERILRPEGHRVLQADGRVAMRAVLEDPALDVVLLDLRLGPDDGFEVLEALRRDRPDVEVIVMTGHASIQSVVESMRRGAFDYLEKPFDDVERVRSTVRKAIERRRLLRLTREFEDELRGKDGMPELIGSSPAMRSLRRTIRGLRHNESNVLVLGPSGTGKELVARAIHATGPRRGRSFVPVDCGSLPETIIESELFGHEKGAFTGAIGAAGLFRRADGGTLLLDEIGELPSGLQTRLLRVLQEREVRPVGASRSVPVNIRVIAATHRDLALEVAQGRFRTDLYYRLNVVRVEVPPLRDRREDVPLLVEHFLRKHRRRGDPVQGIEPEALEVLVRHDWPGNVRELENAVESALALASAPLLRRGDLRIAACGGVAAAPGPEVPLSLEAFERCALERALAEARGDASEAARRLGIGRSTFYRKLSRHGLPTRRATTGPGDAVR